MPELFVKRCSTYVAIFFAYIAVWADVIFSLPEPAALSALWFIVGALKNTVRIVFVLYIASKMSIFAAHRWSRAFEHLPSRAELWRAISVMLLSLGCAGIGVAVSWLSGISNPLFARYQRGAASLLPLILVSSISVGYAEELFFRFFLIDGLAEAGASLGTASIVSILIFGLSHGSQGVFGIAFAGLLAAFYTGLKFRGYSLHSLALGHAFYDVIVLVVVVLA
jgi:membrane protease YdiL (CAAX protease family)